MHGTRCEPSLASNFENNLTFEHKVKNMIMNRHIHRYDTYERGQILCLLVKSGEILHLFTMSVLRNRCKKFIYFFIIIIIFFIKKIQCGIFIDIRCPPNTPGNLMIALCEKKSYLSNPFGEFGYLPLSPPSLGTQTSKPQKEFFLE